MKKEKWCLEGKQRGLGFIRGPEQREEEAEEEAIGGGVRFCRRNMVSSMSSESIYAQ